MACTVCEVIIDKNLTKPDMGHGESVHGCEAAASDPTTSAEYCGHAILLLSMLSMMMTECTE